MQLPLFISKFFWDEHNCWKNRTTPNVTDMRDPAAGHPRLGRGPPQGAGTNPSHSHPRVAEGRERSEQEPKVARGGGGWGSCCGWGWPPSSPGRRPRRRAGATSSTRTTGSPTTPWPSRYARPPLSARILDYCARVALGALGDGG